MVLAIYLTYFFNIRKFCHLCAQCIDVPVTVAARSRVWVCGRSLSGAAGSNPAREHGYPSVVSLVCCAGRCLCDGLITRPEESYWLWCVTECDHEALIMRRAWPTGGGGGLLSHGKKKMYWCAPWHVNFSQRCCWILRSSGMLCCVTGWKYSDVSKEHVALIFRVKQFATWLLVQRQSLTSQNTRIFYKYFSVYLSQNKQHFFFSLNNINQFVCERRRTDYCALRTNPYTSFTRISYFQNSEKTFCI